MKVSLLGLAVLIFGVGCSSPSPMIEIPPTPNIEATVAARLVEERASSSAYIKQLSPSVENPNKETVTSSSGWMPDWAKQAYPTVVPRRESLAFILNTAVPTMELTPTTVAATPTSIPNLISMHASTPTLIPTPTYVVIPTPVPTLVPPPTPTTVPTVAPTPVPVSVLEALNSAIYKGATTFTGSSSGALGSNSITKSIEVMLSLDVRSVDKKISINKVELFDHNQRVYLTLDQPTIISIWGADDLIRGKSLAFTYNFKEDVSSLDLERWRVKWHLTTESEGTIVCFDPDFSDNVRDWSTTVKQNMQCNRS